MVTIKDVARIAGVSTSTVSRVVRKQGKVGKVCRAKVQKVIDELGYRPNINAQALVSKKSNSLGVVIPQVSMPFFGSLACGAEEATKENNYRVLIINALENEQAELDAIDSLLQHRCGAIVFHSVHCSDETLADLAEKIPGLVLINRLVSKVAHRCVWLDNNTGAQEATRYLVNKGHADFAIITRQDTNPDSQVRLDGIRTAINNANIQLDTSLIAYGDTADMDGGRQSVRHLLDQGKKFTAVLCYNDNMAVGVIHELHARGIRVPEDISVIGFDDLLISIACIPELTTMHYPIREMASYAANLAIELSDNVNSSGRTHLFMPHLIERDSVNVVDAK
ncbi:LacI family DNA-binding transcriptional regulator [Colwellia sp. 12G3]|jgi:LacI family transcriptional regulator|uniref:LacI family DNA-binding transcriptional regulator n=1 Tax=Colwellia sp. 12G3 TaxID=2058299 RepID=UPI000C32BEF2|nr:LacI family DNA-binding transcriptional regulator [Colwellia sp. 12G3]PKI16672.1 DNA-binding transcriptional regulator GalS [Colwellia sp. 12G3]